MNDISLSIGIDPEQEVETIRKLDPFHHPEYSKCDDISFAFLFSDINRRRARYNKTAKLWYIYDGSRWKPDLENMQVETLAKIMTRALMIYSADVESTDYKMTVAKLAERRRRVTMITDARDRNCIEQSDLDNDGSLFNCQNGVLNIDSGEFLDHDSDLLLSKISNVFYDPDAKSPVFDKFMHEIMCGDEGKIKYLQQLFGYAMCSRNIHEECYIGYGAKTRNGKSTLFDTIGYVFGDYAMNIQPETLAMKDRNTRNASGDIARLDGCRFLHCSEPPKGMRFDVALLKTLLGRDKITARNLYEREFEFIPVFKLFINTNYLPIVTDDTLFSSGRVKVISFDRHFEEHEQDPMLKEKLKTQENVSGIFNWIFDGWKEYQSNKGILAVPETVRDATNDYREKSDKIKLFLDECTFPVSDGCIKGSDAYESFSKWCRSNGYFAENRRNFLEILRSKNILAPTGTIDGNTYHNVIKGYELIADDAVQDQERVTPFE